MYRGEFQLGDLLSLQLQTTSAGVGAEPDDPPRAFVYSTSGIVESHLLPIADERNVTGRFWMCRSLDSKYATGYHWIHYMYVMGGITKSTVESFEIVAGGDPKGAGISMEHFRRPPNSFVVLQTDGGFLLRKKNPEVT